VADRCVIDGAAIDRPLRLRRSGELWQGSFEAMASPCEILMAFDDRELAQQLLQIAATEAWRIEQKYSRYRSDGIVAQINSADGHGVNVDNETAQLLDFAYQCYQLSDGLFDISSGILRRIWSFKAGEKPPLAAQINELLPLIGLRRANWESPCFNLPSGMEIDFGGIGKEYAVDRTLELLTAIVDAPLLVNYGGDIHCNRAPKTDQPWRIGIEDAAAEGVGRRPAEQLLAVSGGGVATSGSSRRFLLHRGRRYGHVLNPLTGRPVEHSPLSVTVAAQNCTQAGMLATFAMLQGAGAEEFLNSQQVEYWLRRE